MPTWSWPTSKPQAVNLSISTLDQLDAQIRTNYPHIRSLLMVRHGQLALEHYYGTDTGDELHNFASGAKSFTATLLGILLHQKRITHLRQKFIEFCDPAIPHNPAIEAITIEHLLMMASGLHWGKSPREVDRWLSRDDWLQTLLSLPVRDKPGTVFAYKPDPRLISHIIETVTSENPLAFAQINLFGPLGITDVSWPDNGSGDGIQLRPRDVAKLGQLYLQNGAWNGQQLLDPEYIRAATTSHILGNFPENDGYGFLWWTTPIGEHQTFYASGFGGQYLFVVPGLDIVALITSTMDQPHIENKHLIRNWLRTIA